MSEEKGTSLFRKKSEEYIDSPEKLDHYLHVTNPGIWALLLAVLVLFIGFVAWSFMARLETHVAVAVVSENDTCTAYVPAKALDAVVKARTVSLNNQEYSLSPDSPKPETVTDETNIYIRLAADLSVGDVVYEIPMDGDLNQGVYSGIVTTETLSPISLLLN